MALGNSDIKYVEDKMVNAGGQLPILEDCWNTFNYVAKNLDEWATETEIGNELRSNCITIANELKKNINSINTLLVGLRDLATAQRNTNKG